MVTGVSNSTHDDMGSRVYVTINKLACKVAQDSVIIQPSPGTVLGRISDRLIPSALCIPMSPVHCHLGKGGEFPQEKGSH